MWGSHRNSSQLSNKKQQKHEKEGFAVSFRPENFIPGLVIGFLLGMLLDLSKPVKNCAKNKTFLPGKLQEHASVSSNGDQDLKMVLVVRQDLKMGNGKIASQCAHAATGMYAELMQSGRVPSETMGAMWTAQNSRYMQESTRNVSRNKLREAAENMGLPTFLVADAGRTQVSAGSRTVLAIGPGPKTLVDSVTGKQRLL